MNPKQIAILISEDIHINNGLMFEDARPGLLALFKKELEDIAGPSEFKVSATKDLETDLDPGLDTIILSSIGRYTYTISFKWINKKMYAKIIDYSFDIEDITNGYSNFKSIKDVCKFIVKWHTKYLDWSVRLEHGIILIYNDKIAIVSNDVLSTPGTRSQRLKAHKSVECSLALPENMDIKKVATAFNNNEMTLEIEGDIEGDNPVLKFDTDEGKIRLLFDDDIVFLTQDMVESWNAQEDEDENEDWKTSSVN